MKLKSSCIILLSINSLSANAEVTLDGTLGRNGALPGPDYLIGADLGRQHGGNLFHSFQGFNLNHSESATFSGPNSVSNIISRVTGGNPSNIDGLIRSTISNADMYFLNPYGIMFGPNARLDVQGSFHASTADYLRLGDGGRFDARNPSNSLLTIAPIESFGFLDNPHGSIQVNGRGMLNGSGTPRALLQVPDGKSLSLIGGDIHLSQGMDEEDLDKLLEDDTSKSPTPEEKRVQLELNQRYSQLRAPGGTLNLASIQQAGEIALTKNGLHSTATQSGTIQLEQQAFLSTTGENGGNLFIRAGQFIMTDSRFEAHTLGIEDGGLIDIQAETINLQNSDILAHPYNLGNGPDIQLNATESINIKESGIWNYSGRGRLLNYEFGNAGHVTLRAKNMALTNITIMPDTYSTGQAGNLTLMAENNLHVNSSYIQTNSNGTNENAGQAGNIHLQANNLTIDTSAFYANSSSIRNSGSITVQASQLHLKGSDFNKGGLTNSSQDGNAGPITIRANKMWLEEGFMIDSRGYGTGNGGHIDIQVNDRLTIKGASPNDGHPARILSNAGKIHITAQEILLADGGLIDASSDIASGNDAGQIHLEVQGALILSGVNPYGENADGFASRIAANGHVGHAGNIQINAGSISIVDGALIESHTTGQGHGGQITLQVRDQIIISGDASQIVLREPSTSQMDYLEDNKPTTYNQSTSGIYAYSTSRELDSGNSGRISISTPQLTLNNQAQISTASQGGGQAGQITLHVNQLFMSHDALIRSNNDLPNQFTFNDIQERDNTIIGLGTVVDTSDIGNNQTVSQINIGNTLLNVTPVSQVPDMAALNELSEQRLLTEGDLVLVEDIGNGQSGRFVYNHKIQLSSILIGESWTQIDENTSITLESLTKDTVETVVFMPGSVYLSPDFDSYPYTAGTYIHVKDIGNGKSADYVVTRKTATPPFGGDTMYFVGYMSPIKYYQVTDMAALQQLAITTDLATSTAVDVSNAGDGSSARFYYTGEDWVRAGRTVTVADINTQENLVLAKQGYIANLPTGNRIYTGSEWIPLNQTYRVNTLIERNALSVQNGDLVKVADVGNGRHDAFLSVDGQWIQQIRGGDAGQITINADKIQLSDGSEISTGSISGGGGSLTLNVDKMVYLNNSQVSTSVQEGVGSGGDLTIDGSQFVVMNNGKIIAQAYEGQGGNIYIKSGQFVTSPNSLVSASSRLGLDGEVKIDSPAVDLSGALLVLSSGFDVDESFDEPCKAAQAGNSFVVKPIFGVPPIASDWKANQLILLPVSDEKTPSPIKDKTAGQSPEKVALLTLTGCQLNLSAPPARVGTAHRAVKKSCVIPEPQLF